MSPRGPLTEPSGEQEGRGWPRPDTAGAQQRPSYVPTAQEQSGKNEQFQEGGPDGDPKAEGGGDERGRQEGMPGTSRGGQEGRGERPWGASTASLIDQPSHALAQQWPSMAKQKGT